MPGKCYVAGVGEIARGRAGGRGGVTRSRLTVSTDVIKLSKRVQ